MIATAKEGDLRVYDLDSPPAVQSLPAPAAPGPDHAPGRFNNVDLVRGLRLSPGGTATWPSPPTGATTGCVSTASTRPGRAAR